MQIVLTPMTLLSYLNPIAVLYKKQDKTLILKRRRKKKNNVNLQH